MTNHSSIELRAMTATGTTGADPPAFEAHTKVVMLCGVPATWPGVVKSIAIIAGAYSVCVMMVMMRSFAPAAVKRRQITSPFKSAAARLIL